MTEYVLDLKDVRSQEDLHDVIEATLPLPGKYERTLDSLRKLMPQMDLPMHIRIINFEDAEVALKGYFYAMGLMFDDMVEAIPEITYELAAQDSGPQIIWSED